MHNMQGARGISAHQHLVVQLHALNAAVQLGLCACALCLHLHQIQRQIKQLILEAPAHRRTCQSAYNSKERP